jgi:hypothetical protein
LVSLETPTIPSNDPAITSAVAIKSRPLGMAIAFASE